MKPARRTARNEKWRKWHAQPWNVLSSHSVDSCADEFETRNVKNFKQRDWSRRRTMHTITMKPCIIKPIHGLWNVCTLRGRAEEEDFTLAERRCHFIIFRQKVLHFHIIPLFTVWCSSFLFLASNFFLCICTSHSIEWMKEEKFAKRWLGSCQYWAFAILFIRLHSVFPIPIREDVASS